MSRKSKQSYLKTKNVPVIVLFIIWCLALYATFFSGSGSFWADLQTKFAGLNKKNGFVVSMMPLLVLVFCGVTNSSFKATLVFWRLKNALPGHRVFSRLAPRDPRIDMVELRKKLGEIPRAAKEQNTLWYKLYRQHQSAAIVENPHRAFLLARDLSVMALIFAIGGAVGLVFGRLSLQSIFLYFGIMLVQSIILGVVARNHANSMVCNVLVEYLRK